jgi:hypothetical protein
VPEGPAFDEPEDGYSPRWDNSTNRQLTFAAFAEISAAFRSAGGAADRRPPPACRGRRRLSFPDAGLKRPDDRDERYLKQKRNAGSGAQKYGRPAQCPADAAKCRVSTESSTRLSAISVENAGPIADRPGLAVIAF